MRIFLGYWYKASPLLLKYCQLSAVIVGFLGTTYSLQAKALQKNASLQDAATVIDSPEVLNVYPNCDYQIIDTLSVTQNVGLSRDTLNRDDVYEAAQRIINRILNQAERQSADAIILIERDLNVVDLLKFKSINFSAPKYNTLTLTAELIEQCASDPNAPIRLTPLNANGTPQKELSLGSLGGWQQTIELDISGSNKRVITQLVNNAVSLAEGGFGLKLLMSLNDVQQILGTPTLSLHIDEQYLALAYGRGLWLVFKDDVLVSLSSEQPWLSSEFINFLTFDDRIDDIAWTVEGRFIQGQPIATSELEQSTNSQALVFTNDDSRLELGLEMFAIDNETERRSKAQSFSLSLKSYQAPILTLQSVPDRLLMSINAFLNKNTSSIDIADIDLKPRASAWLSNTKSIHWYEGAILVEMNGASVTKIHLLENPVLNLQRPSTWQIFGIEQYQSLQKTLESLEGDIFHLGDTVELTQGHFVFEMNFYELEKDPVVISAEITIY